MMRVTIVLLLEAVVLSKFLVSGMGLSFLRETRQAANSTNQQASNSGQQTNPNIFMQPSQFVDPGFSLANPANSASSGNSTSSQSGIPSQFMPSFLDPSKFSMLGQQPGTGFAGPSFGQPSGSGGTASGSGSGAVMNPNLFTNPGTNSSSGFNLMNPSQFVGKR